MYCCAVSACSARLLLLAAAALLVEPKTVELQVLPLQARLLSRLKLKHPSASFRFPQAVSSRRVGGAASLGVAVSAAVDGAGAAGGDSCTRRSLSLA